MIKMYNKAINDVLNLIASTTSIVVKEINRDEVGFFDKAKTKAFWWTVSGNQIYASYRFDEHGELSNIRSSNLFMPSQQAELIEIVCRYLKEKNTTNIKVEPHFLIIEKWKESGETFTYKTKTETEAASKVKQISEKYNLKPVLNKKKTTKKKAKLEDLNQEVEFTIEDRTA